MQSSRIIRSFLFLVCSIGCIFNPLFANVPQWWTEYSVGPKASEQSQPVVMAGNYQPALLGQAKFMAYQAWQAMEATEKGSAGSAIEAMVKNFGTDEADNYQILLLGQLKAIAFPFYQRFQERSYSVTVFDIEVSSAGYPFPWTDPGLAGYDVEINYQPANIGQMKYLFSFGLENWGLKPTFTLDDLSAQDGNPATPEIEIGELSFTLSGSIDTTNFGSFSVDGDILGSVTDTGPFSFTHPLLHEGENVLNLVLQDQSGNSVEQSLTLYRITQPPSLLVSSPEADLYYTRQASFDLVGSVGISASVINVNGASIVIEDDGGFRHTVALAEGENLYTLTVEDALGNSQQLERWIVLDTTAPSVHEPTVLDGHISKTPVLVLGGSLTEDGILYINGEKIVLSDDGAFAFSHKVQLVEGENTVTMILQDVLGNSITEEIQVFFDPVPPQLVISSPSDGLSTNIGSISIVGSVDDAHATLTLNGNSILHSDGAFAEEIMLVEGANIVVIQALDQAGNLSEKVITIVHDTVAPSFITLNPGENQTSGTASITLSGEVDDESASITVVLNGSLLPVSLDSGIFESALALIDGLNSVVVTATDPAGNSVSGSFTITFDQSTLPPLLTDPPNYIPADRLSSLSGTAEPGAEITIVGGLAPVSATVDSNGDFSTGTILLKANQPNDLVLRLVDPYGNEAESSFRVISDTVAPSISLASPLEGAIIKGLELLVVGRVTDANPGDVLFINGTEVPLRADGQFAIVRPLSMGVQTLTFDTTDLAGNEAVQLVRSFTVQDPAEDTTSPMVTVLAPFYNAVLSDPSSVLELLLVDASGISSVLINGVSVDLSGLVDGFLNLPVTFDASGELLITVTDNAVPANTTVITHRIDIDSLVPTTPVVRLVAPSSPTHADEIALYLTIDPDTQYRITGGLVESVEGQSPANGQFTAIVALNKNEINTLSIAAIGENGLENSIDFDVVQDQIAPFISSTIPAESETGVELNSSIMLTFSEPVQEISAFEISVTENGTAATFTAMYSADGVTLTLDPSEDFKELSDITITLPETFSDLAGNSLTGGNTLSFRSQDTVAPDAPVELLASRSRTNQNEVQISGTAESNSMITVEGGALSTIITVDASGAFTLPVSLNLNVLNILSVTATDESDNVSDAAMIEVDHNDTPLVLVSVTPTGNSVLLDAKFDLIFNRELDPEAISGIALTGYGLGAVSHTITLGTTPEIVVLTPDPGLAHAVEYKVIIPPSVLDLYGNTLDTDPNITFTTVAADAPAAPIIHESYPKDLTHQEMITIIGYATPGTVLTINGGLTVVTYPESGVIDNSGEFTTQISLRLDEENTITLTAAISGGNASPSSEPIVITQDSTLPLVESVSPQGSNVAITTTVSVAFSEAIDLAGINATPAAIRFLDGQNSPVDGDWFPSTDQRVFTYYPSQDLQPNMDYTMVIDGNLRDLAGNAIVALEAHGFTTTSSEETDSDLLPAPVITPLDFERTIQPSITYRGTAEPNTTLYILGGQSAVSTTVDSAGNFVVSVPLVQDSENQLVVYVEDNEGNVGASSTLTITHSSRETGLRILSPQQGIEYNNRSVMVTGILDNVEAFTRVTLKTEANGMFESDEVLIFEKYFAKQFILQPYQLILQQGLTSVDEMPTFGERLLVIADVAGVLHFRFFDYQGMLSEFSESDYLQEEEALIALKSALQPLWGVGEIDDATRTEVENKVMAITQHSLAEGPQQVTVTGEMGYGSMVSESVSFDLFIQPQGLDTRPPNVTILYPEPGEVIKENIVETMLTVEEGLKLQSIYIDGVSAHNQLGNFAFIYYRPQLQGDNILQVIAQDFSGNIGNAEITVYFDSIPVQNPTVDSVVSELPGREIPLVSTRVIMLSGTGEAGSIIEVFNGLVTVRTTVGENGYYSLKVALNPNTRNNLLIAARDQVGNYSEEIQLSVVHDDTAPYPVDSVPSSGQVGVALDTSISIDFSEPLDPTTVDASTVTLSRINEAINAGEETPISEYNVLLSADGKTITILPDFKFYRSETINVELTADLRDLNNRRMKQPYQFTFTTALYQTTLSGVVVDRSIQSLQNIKVGILDTDIFQYTSSFGTFVLDELPLGEQILYVDARPDSTTGVQPQGDERVFNYLEFPVFIEQNTDNSLGRPIFMVDTDFSTATPVNNLTGTHSLTFESERSNLQGFELIYKTGAARFADGTDRGEITATRIEPDRIPDRLPSGAIPHFMVEIGPDELSFSTPVSLRFPNAYDLQTGDEVLVFHFKHGLADYKELARVTVGADLTAFADNVLSKSGFVGFVPVGGSFDYTRAYLEGRVVDGNGDGIAGVSVNAIAGTSYVFTDALGYYRIPLPEVRIIMIQTFATISTRSSNGDTETPDLIYPSELVELATSGTTTVPDIIIDSFTLEGNVRYFDHSGTRLGLTGYGTDGEGHVTSIDAGDARLVDVFVYRRLQDNAGVAVYDSVPYMQAVTNLSELLNTDFDVSFSMSFLGSLENSGGDSPSPKPGDIIKVVAFDSHTGFYGEADIVIEPPGGEGASAANVLKINIDLRPPELTLDMNRVFYIDSIRRRANIPNRGIVFTQDEFVEFKTRWRTADVIPLARSELFLPSRLRVESIDYKTDYNFRIRGGEQFQILEIREAFYPSRLDVLQRETDVGRETLTISRDGSFGQDSLVPIIVQTGAYGTAQSQLDSVSITEPATQEVFINILDLSYEELDDGTTAIDGRTLPGETISVAGVELTSDANGYFSNQVEMEVGEGGIMVDMDDSVSTRFGASFTPVISSITPGRGSQGDQVLIEGLYFSTHAQDNKVSFNGAQAEVIAASETRLKVIVPSEASSGDVTVTVAGKVSNAIYFEFISYGINNGSFESGDLRGFVIEGNGEVIENRKNTLPTDRQFMALLDTAHDPVSGVSSITTDPFIVSDLGLEPYFVFDYYIMGTAVLAPLDSCLSVFVLTESGDVVQVSDVFPSIDAFNSLRLNGYNKGSGFRAASVNLANTGVSIGDTIRVRIQLKGRGRLTSFIPGARSDDANPIDQTKKPGTALLLDNLRLSTSVPTALPIDPEQLGAPAFETSAGDRWVVLTSTQTLPADSRVYVASLLSGTTRSFDVDVDGTFTLRLAEDDFLPLLDPFNEPLGRRKGYLLLWYRTPDSSTQGEPSNRYYSAPVELQIVSE